MSTYPCPKNGCASTDPDWCSECGANMRPEPAPVQPNNGLANNGLANTGSANNGSANNGSAGAATAMLCPDCGTPRDGQDEWCGVCRYNFVTGQSFSPAAAAPVAPPKPVADLAKAVTLGQPKGAWYVVIDFDPAIDPGVDVSTVKPRPQLTFPLDLPELRIGRKNGKDHPELPIDDEGVSSRHAKISFTADGDPVLLDLASTNGTSVNGTPIIAGAPVALSSGDVVTIGRWTRITVKAR